MDIMLLLYIIIVIALIVVVFKLIKKILFAIIASVFIVVISVVGIGVLVYMDIQSIAQIEDATINVAYLQNGEFHTGISFPFSQEDELNPFDVTTLSLEEFNREVDNPSENTFTITIESEVFSIIEDEVISFSDLIGDTGGIDIGLDEVGLRVEDLQLVLDSSNPQEEFTQIILRELDLGAELESIAEPLLVDALIEIEEIQGMDLQSLTFSLLLNELVQDESNVVSLISEFQDGNIEVFPNKLSFTLVRYLPISFVQNLITSD